MAEVAILGGGFAGLGTACSLQERGVRSVAVVEAGALGQGASGRNGGFVFGGFSRGPAQLLSDWGAETARSLYALTQAAVGLMRQRIDRYAIDCDKTEGGAWWVDWFDSARSRAVMQRHADLMREVFATDWEPLTPDQVRQGLQTERYGGGLLERNAFHCHPLRYAQGLGAAIVGQGGAVFEQSPVQRIEREAKHWFLHTAQGRVRAEQLVLAGGGYMQRVLPRLERARLPIATYMMATEPLADHPVRTDAAVYDNRFAFDYYRRPPDGRLLWGGRISIRQRHPAAIAALLRRDLRKVFPQLQDARIDFAWGGLMSYATHQMPQIGQLSPGLWFAQAFGGHGVAPTTAAGELLASAITHREHLDARWQHYGLTPVFGVLGLLGAQASYSWAELRDALHEAINR